MGKKTDTIIGLENRFQQRRVRMAYTLNNAQPVLCTLVSDQPFFYLDEETAIDDDYLLDDELFEEGFIDPDLENQLMDMKKKIDLYDRSAAPQKINNPEREKEFIDSFTKQAPIDLDELLILMKESRIARAYLDAIYDRGIYIQNSNQCESAQYDAEAKTIFIRDDLPKTEAVIAFLRALRSAWQDGQEAAVNPLSLHPDYAILINRVQKADLSVAVIRAAWELKLTGHDDIWSYVDQSSMNDLARALAREALSDFRTLNNGKAQAAAFETWFLSDRCKDIDKSLINAMLSGYEKFTFGEESLQSAPIAQIIARVGEMPFGKNYLAAYTSMIMQDTLFSDVRDRANANFLWFIKFERAFDETEQALQLSGDLPTSGIDPVIHNQFEDTHNDASRSKELYEKSKSGSDMSGTDNVIRVAFGYPQDQCNRS